MLVVVCCDVEVVVVVKVNFLVIMSYEICILMSGMLGMFEVFEDIGLDEE